MKRYIRSSNQIVDYPDFIEVFEYPNAGEGKEWEKYKKMYKYKADSGETACYYVTLNKPGAVSWICMYPDSSLRFLRPGGLEVEMNKEWREYTPSEDDFPVQISGFSFDFIYENYDEDATGTTVESAIETAVYAAFAQCGCEATAVAFETVDYSGYPEYADKDVGQCGVDFEWSKDYDDKRIEKTVEEELANIGVEVIGSTFYSFD